MMRKIKCPSCGEEIEVPDVSGDAMVAWQNAQEEYRKKEQEDFKAKFGHLPQGSAGTLDPKDETLDQERESC